MRYLSFLIFNFYELRKKIFIKPTKRNFKPRGQAARGLRQAPDLLFLAKARGAELSNSQIHCQVEQMDVTSGGPFRLHEWIFTNGMTGLETCCPI